MTRFGRAIAAMLAVLLCLGVIAVDPRTSDPHRVFEAAHRSVVIDAGSRTIHFDGSPLADAAQVVDAAELEGYLLVAQRDGVVLVYELPAPEVDGVPTLVQRIENLGHDIRAIIVSIDTGRALLLSAGTTELFGLRIHERDVIDRGDVKEPAYFGHARFLDFLRDDASNTQQPRAFAIGAQVMALATDKELLEIFYLDRSYRVLDRTPLPDGLARVDAITHTGAHWVLAGLDTQAEPVLMASDKIAGPWSDLGVSTLDAVLAADDDPIAWLPGGFTVSDRRVELAIRGERGAVASWPLSTKHLTSESLEIRWLSPK